MLTYLLTYLLDNMNTYIFITNTMSAHQVCSELVWKYKFEYLYLGSDSVMNSIMIM